MSVVKSAVGEKAHEETLGYQVSKAGAKCGVCCINLSTSILGSMCMRIKLRKSNNQIMNLPPAPESTTMYILRLRDRKYQPVAIVCIRHSVIQIYKPLLG